MANTLLRVGTITINRRKLIRAPTPHIAGTAGSSWVCCLPVNTFWSPNRSLLVLPMHFWMNAHNTVKFLGPDHLLDSVNTYFRSNSWLGIFKHYILRIVFVIILLINFFFFLGKFPISSEYGIFCNIYDQRAIHNLLLTQLFCIHND